MWTQVTILTFVLAATVVVAMPSKQEDKNETLVNSSLENSECLSNADCPETRACKNSTCINPCNVWCAADSVCEVSNHTMSKCSCPEGKIGNPLVGCKEIGDEGAYDPCEESHFEPVSTCSEILGHVICTCQSKAVEKHILKGPTCTLNSDCNHDLTCIRNLCINPCSDVCGVNAYCTVRNHIPICACPPTMTGNPFTECRIITDKEYFGGDLIVEKSPCASSSDCDDDSACSNQRCVDPCSGVCGNNAQCIVKHHNPICTCPPDTTGDPFIYCQFIEHSSLKNSSCDCGANAYCENGKCICLPDYFGEPYIACRPECVINSDCSLTHACVNYKCINPCIGICGQNADCEVLNHKPSCMCPLGMTGNPLVDCEDITGIQDADDVDIDVCSPSPCGPYSVCREINRRVECTCQPGYVGVPPNCRPECTINEECPSNKACINNHCRDPCAGTCGLNAKCKVIIHNPICTCPPGKTGDPFTRCPTIEEKASS